MDGPRPQSRIATVLRGVKGWARHAVSPASMLTRPRFIKRPLLPDAEAIAAASKIVK